MKSRTKKSKSAALPNSLLRMTEAVREESLAIGCDPHCHACLRALENGDLYAMKVFETGIEHMLAPGLTGEGLVIRGMCCERCNHENRPLAESERATILDRFRLRQPEEPSTARPAEPPRRRLGCFELPDGTKF